MIDLDRTEAQMLAAIDAHAGAASEPAQWHLAGRTPAELLPAVAARLSQYYEHLPASDVSDHLIALIKKGLGNGYKWGNQRDPGKQLIVTGVTSRRGAVITISDQGGGFDVAGVIHDGTFTHGGSGFARFHRTSSVISYANGGRTLLIQFLAKDGPHDVGSGVAAASEVLSKSAPIDFHALKALDHVKVKCIRRPNGDLVATKIRLKPPDAHWVIEAPLQHVGGRALRILDRIFVVSEQMEIVGADMRKAAFEQLQGGQVVELTGRYVSRRLVPIRMKIRGTVVLDRCELQGAIDELRGVEQRFRMLGFVVIVDHDMSTLGP